MNNGTNNPEKSKVCSLLMYCLFYFLFIKCEAKSAVYRRPLQDPCFHVEHFVIHCNCKGTLLFHSLE